MKPKSVDRDTFLRNLRFSKLLTREELATAVQSFGPAQAPRDLARTLVSTQLLTRFQAKMLLSGRNYGFFLGPYRILDILGQGGMGRVYKALHQTMNRVVALKVLSNQTFNTPRARQLFLREVQAAAKLNHPNIVMAYDANEFDGRHYLAMEFVDGPSLEGCVRAHGTLPVGMACEIIFQTAHGLQHAFERGMVHRDIKPANLLFQKEPGSDTLQVKILDFGLARLHTPVLPAANESNDKKPHVVMGTPDFLSPEQFKNLHDADIRSDLYSLGCTFFYLLTGEVPFPGGSIMDKLIRHSSEIPRSLEEFRPDVPKSVAEIVCKLMAKRPEDRFQTPDEVMEALAPHAAPSVMAWPTPLAPAPAAKRPEDDGGTVDTNDTEPRAQARTRIGDEESILEWVDTNRRQRQRSRRTFLAAAAFATILGLVIAVLLWIAIHPR